MMKFSAFALLATAMSAQAATLYGVNPPAEPTTWNVQDTETNDLSFSFSNDGGALDSDDTTYLAAKVTDCNSNSGDYSITAPALDTELGVGSDVTVTFTNDVHIDDTCFCAKVELIVSGSSKVVATGKADICVTADSNGNVDVVYTFADNHLDITQTTEEVVGASISEDRTVDGDNDISIAPENQTPYLYGDDITFELEEISVPGGGASYYYEVQSAEATSTGNFGSVVDYSPTQGTHTFDIEDIEMVHYVTAILGSAIQVTFDVEWWSYNPNRRLTADEARKLQASTEPVAGKEQVSGKVKLAPLEESGAYTFKLVGVSAMCVAAAALL